MHRMSYTEYIFTVHCSTCSSVATSSSGKSLTRSKKVSIPKNIMKTEQNRRNKNMGTKSGTTLVRGRKPGTNGHPSINPLGMTNYIVADRI